MTSEEMERDLENLGAYLSCTRLTVRRCKHPSVTQSALWVFDGERQVASVSREGAHWWVTHMKNGVPYAARGHYRNLCESAERVIALWTPAE